MVEASGRAITVRATASAGIVCPSASNSSRKLGSTFSGYTHASIRPDSSPNNPARVPTALRNSHGRSVRDNASVRCCAQPGPGKVKSAPNNVLHTKKFHGERKRGGLCILINEDL